MGLFKNLFGLGKAATVSSPSSWTTSAGGGTAISGASVNSRTALLNSTVLACVRVISTDVAKSALSLYLKMPDGSRVETKDHPLWWIIAHRPNDWQDVFFFWETMVAALALRGNAYAVLRRDGRGRVLAMIPVHPDRVTLFEAPDGLLFYGVSRNGMHEIAQLDDFEYMIPGDYMLHLRGMSRDGLQGISVIEYAREAIGLALAQERQAARMALNGARPGGIIEAAGKISQETADRFRAAWDKTYGGVDNTGKVMLLAEGLTWKPMTISSVDAQFLEQRKYQVEEICRIFGVPPHKVADLSRSTNNNVESQALSYFTDTLMGWFERIESALNFQLLSDADLRAGYYFEFDTRRLLRGDIKTQQESYRLGRQWGWLSVNEIRADLGLENVEGGDIRLQPMNMQPLGEPQEERPNIPGDVPKADLRVAVAKALLKRRGGQNG